MTVASLALDDEPGIVRSLVPIERAPGERATQVSSDEEDHPTLVFDPLIAVTFPVGDKPEDPCPREHKSRSRIRSPKLGAGEPF